MPEASEGFVSFRGYKTWYRVVGTVGPDDVPLLCLHGGPGGASDYFEPLEVLARPGRPVIRYDQLGSGRSDRPSDPSLWRIETFVDELATVRNELGIGQVHLLGQSWGGTLAIEYVLGQPSGVRSLILYSSPVDWPLMAEELRRLRGDLPKGTLRAMRRFEDGLNNRRPKATKARKLKRLEHKQIVRMARLTDVAIRVLSKPLAQAMAVRASAIPFLRGASYQVVGLEFNKRHSCRMERWPEGLLRGVAARNREVYKTMWGPTEFFGLGNLRDYDRSARLGEISIPTLIVSGRHDSITPRQSTLLQDGIPGAELMIFEGSSHLAHYEEPERFEAALLSFLERVERTEPKDPSVGTTGAPA